MKFKEGFKGMINVARNEIRNDTRNGNKNEKR